MKTDSIKATTRKIEASYDALPYYFHVSVDTHPEHLAVIAAMHGLKPVAPQHCRVLELACGRGVNLAVIAQSLPQSECVGIELSSEHQQAAVKLAKNLGLKNITFEHKDLLEVTPELGVFDYIIVHGTFSWVPEAVQDHILKICEQNLADTGIALIHYSTYPGASGHDTIRRMMTYHLEPYNEPKERLQASVNFASFLTDGAIEDNPFVAFMRNLKNSSEHEKVNFYHETLGVESQAFYVSDFIHRATSMGLQFLSEAGTPQIGLLSAAARDQLEHIPDLVRREQYTDFLLNRKTRATLLCHKHHRLNFTPSPDAVRDYHICSTLQLSPTDDKVNISGEVLFNTPQGVTISTNTPVITTSLIVLAEIWPKTIAFNELVKQSIDRIVAFGIEKNVDEDKESRTLARHLLDWHTSGLCELRLSSVNCVTEVHDRPEAYRLARVQASLRDRSALITNVRHENVTLDGFDQLLLEQLDGSRDRTALVDALIQFFHSSNMIIREHDKAVTDPDRVRELLAKRVDESLHNMARSAMLVN